MTLTELQDKLGTQIELLTSSQLTGEEKAELISSAQTISSLAKQMINNADVVLRAEKLIHGTDLKGTKIEQML